MVKDGCYPGRQGLVKGGTCLWLLDGHFLQLAAGAYLPLQVMGLNVGADCKYCKG